MGMKVLHDYEREWKNLQNAQTFDKTICQKDFADGLKIADTSLSRHFAEFRRQEDDDEIRSSLRRIARLGNDKLSTYVEGFQPSDIEEASTLSKIAYGAADRVGFSPQAATINVNQQNIQALVIPPLFAGEEAQGVKRMMEE